MARFSEVPSASPLQSLFLRLHTQYPGDIGLLSLFFLNYLTLSRGQAIFLGPNIPHAYISGECVECMATSDNVVRAGLTPKYKDIDTLIGMLTYESGKQQIMATTQFVLKESTGVVVSTLYSPPADFPEFSVVRIVLSAGGSFRTAPLWSSSIMLIVSGDVNLTITAGESAGNEKIDTIAVRLVANEAIMDASSGNGCEVFIALSNKT